jgi:hypothetical protein
MGNVKEEINDNLPNIVLIAGAGKIADIFWIWEVFGDLISS